jgi:hypothetical protein
MEVNIEININQTIVRVWTGFICLRKWPAANFYVQGSTEVDQFLELLTSACEEEFRSMGLVSLYCLR